MSLDIRANLIPCDESPLVRHCIQRPSNRSTASQPTGDRDQMRTDSTAWISASPEEAKLGSRTLSRWRQRFEPRGDYQQKRRISGGSPPFITCRHGSGPRQDPRSCVSGELPLVAHLSRERTGTSRKRPERATQEAAPGRQPLVDDMGAQDQHQRAPSMKGKLSIAGTLSPASLPHQWR
jgi:hypothetical protein